MGLNSVRITPDNEKILAEKCKQRGDKTKIINEALSKYFLPQEEQKPTIKASEFKFKELIT